MNSPAPNNWKAIKRRPCSNCPFRKDKAGIELEPGRLEGIVRDLLANDFNTFVCHKTLGSRRMTCAGAVGLLSKIGRLPVIARLAMVCGSVTAEDIQASAEMVVDADQLQLASNQPKKPRHETQQVSGASGGRAEGWCEVG